ncbi:VanW family protein [Kineococcus sp. SYSU DK005]|uniref:VanW family protein n=1 Tax=Kineococcus sp. SYSU DK005 TaxID=3383126 RepID=UPI003D7C69DA
MGRAERAGDEHVHERVDRPAEQDAARGRAGGGRGGPRARTKLLVGLGAGAAVLAGGYLATALALGGQAPRGTTVLGADVGGLDRAGVERALAGPAADVRARPVAVRVTGPAGDVDGSLDPAAAGLAVDVPATAEALTGPAWSPADLWRHVAGGGDERPVTAVDRAALRAGLQPLAQQVERPAVEGAVAFEVRPGDPAAVEPVPTEPAPGRSLDAGRTADAVAAAWPAAAPVQVPARVLEPVLDADEVAAAVRDVARPAVAGDLVVAGGGREVRLAPAAFAPALSVRAVDGGARLVADGAALETAVLAVDPAFETAPQDARIEVADARPSVVPAVEGTDVEPGALAGAVTAALTAPAATAPPSTPPGTPPASASPGTAPGAPAGAPAGQAPSRRAEVPLAVAAPAVSTQDLQSLGIVEQISTFTTNLTADSARTRNIRIASAAVDGTLLRPGEEFSLNDTVGQRTAARGYSRAPVISGGRLVDDYGGGVSQLSTTLFNAVFFAGLDEIEHKPHSFYISRYPEGREATIDWRSIDNRFRNDSGHGVYITAGISGNQLTVSMYGTRRWDVRAEKSGRYNTRAPRTIYDTGSDCSPQSANTGFDVTVTRVMTPVGGGPEQRESWETTYNAQNRIVCGPDPATVRPRPSPSPSASAPAPAPAPSAPAPAPPAPAPAG